jgi:hypothetical protein
MHKFFKIYFHIYFCLSGFGGQWLACWPLVPKFAGSNSDEAVGFFRVKSSSACLPSEGTYSRRFHFADLRRVKNPYIDVEVASVGKIDWSFLTHSPLSLLEGSSVIRTWSAPGGLSGNSKAG